VDPEVARLLTTLVPSVVAVVGTLLGAGVAGYWAMRVARENQQGQRALARDAARRERRERLLSPLLEAALARPGEFLQLSTHLSLGRIGEAAELLDKLARESPVESTAWMVPIGYTVDETITAYVGLDADCVEESAKLLARVKERGPFGHDVTLEHPHAPECERLNALAHDLMDAAVLLHQKAGDFFDHDDPPEHGRAREVHNQITLLNLRKKQLERRLAVLSTKDCPPD